MRWSRRSTSAGASEDVAGAVHARGQAVVEFALVAPVMLLVMLLAVDFGRLFFTYVSVSNAAREGAFFAATHAGAMTFDQASYENDTRAAALREANVQAQGGAGSMTVSVPRCFSPSAPSASIDCRLAALWQGGIGNHVEVATDQPFTFLTPLVGELFGGQLTLSGTAIAPVLNPLDLTIVAGASPTPSPTATPTSTPTQTPTATPPGPTPPPIPAPTLPPLLCSVPNFWNTYWHDPPALATWHEVAGFTGTLTDLTGGKRIKRQTLPAGSVVPCASIMAVDDH